MSRTIEQKRAAFALKMVQEFRGDNDKMSTHVNKTPIRILNNGLGQALAFLQADNEGKTGRDRKESGKLYDWLQEWLSGATDGDHPCRVYQNGNPNLIGQLMAGSRDDYMRAQEDVLALFTWLKKLASAGMYGQAETTPASEGENATQNAQRNSRQQPQNHGQRKDGQRRHR